MEYTVKQLAELAGLTPRTLRWYHREGLLKPARFTEAGYRLYGPGEVDRLQQILFYRELGLELSAIRALLDDPAFDRQAALRDHLKELETRRARLDVLILTVKQTLKGANDMSDSEKFECFKQKVINENEEAYGMEARAKYGDAAVDRSNAMVAGMTKEQYWAFTELEEDIRRKLDAAVQAGADPSGEAGLEVAMLHQMWLSHAWGAEGYASEAHRALAALYTDDQRFADYYDRTVPGCAAFLRRAIEAHIH